MELPDEDVDDPDEEEDVQEDGSDAGDLVDPVVQAILHPASRHPSRKKLVGAPEILDVLVPLIFWCAG